ncbi:hypothetical protein BOTCAL_0063g00220 [Botryotinia calthae]|uniref:Uncharacterized protein n=1 Tax=Botryotinia calthae TaxID=38488 RepID=A0A4Y8D9M1_9HELO|nr:hypothetical protein BOTCAL_0063g00220 [Botryotinia calthae]
MSNYIEATMQDPASQEVNELAARLKRLNIEGTFQPSRKPREHVLSHKRRRDNEGAQVGQVSVWYSYTDRLNLSGRFFYKFYLSIGRGECE